MDKLTEWKQVDPWTIDVGHSVVVEIRPHGPINAHRNFYLEHVVIPLFVAAEASHKACELVLKRISHMDSIRAAQKPVLDILREALRMVPPADDATLAYVISKLDQVKK